MPQGLSRSGGENRTCLLIGAGAGLGRRGAELCCQCRVEWALLAGGPAAAGGGRVDGAWGDALPCRMACTRALKHAHVTCLCHTHTWLKCKESCSCLNPMDDFRGGYPPNNIRVAMIVAATLAGA